MSVRKTSLVLVAFEAFDAKEVRVGGWDGSSELVGSEFSFVRQVKQVVFHDSWFINFIFVYNDHEFSSDNKPV